jgi:hypothetical protein
MGEMITKPDANPILLAVLNFFTYGCLGYILMGQTKKGIITLVMCMVLSPCAGIGLALWLVAIYDCYLLGQKLASGEEIGQMENAVGFLDNIFKE